MKEKVKTGISILIILILFPYVAVVLCTGSMTGTEKKWEPGLEEFVMGILPGQIALGSREEALKAQAVLIRTNLLHKAMEFYGVETAEEAARALKEGDLKELGFVYYDPKKRGELWGYERAETYETRLLEAVQGTKGEILTLEGLPPDLPYHAVSAGRTRDGQVLGEAYAYLKGVECPKDVEALDYLRIEIFSAEEMAFLPEILARDASGYVTEVAYGEERLTGEEFRSRFGLNSSHFTAEAVEEGIRITTKGLGHGLGLSLYQANQWAMEGASYQEILKYFYTEKAERTFVSSG